MHETPEDVQTLQDTLDASIARAGAFLRASFEMPTHSLSARQLVGLLRGMRTVALATVTAKGEPRVAPVGAFFYRGQYVVPTVAGAVRTRHVLARPAVSLTDYAGNDLAILLHGQARVVAPEDGEFAALEAEQRALSGKSVRDWGRGVFLVIEAEQCFTYARHPEEYGV